MSRSKVEICDSFQNNILYLLRFLKDNNESNKDIKNEVIRLLRNIKTANENAGRNLVFDNSYQFFLDLEPLVDSKNFNHFINNDITNTFSIKLSPQTKQMMEIIKLSLIKADNKYKDGLIEILKKLIHDSAEYALTL